MNEVSIIINGVRYDAVCVNKDLYHPCCCNVCDIGNMCLQGDTCLCYTFDIDNHFVFKKSTKSFEKCEWIDVNDRLPNKDENVLVVMQDTDKTEHVEIRWRSIHDDVIVDENGFAIYPPVESRVIAWLPIPNYNKNGRK